MFKIKAWVFTPQVVICYILLVAILAFVANPRTTVHSDMDTDGVVREYESPDASTTNDGSYGTHTLTYKDMKDYQFSVAPGGKFVVVYDYERLVGVMPLDKNCNLTLLLEMDND